MTPQEVIEDLERSCSFRSEIFKAIKRHEGMKIQGVLVDIIASEILTAAISLIKEKKEVMSDEEILKVLNLLANNCYEEGQGRLYTTMAIEVDRALAALSGRIAKPQTLQPEQLPEELDRSKFCLGVDDTVLTGAGIMVIVDTLNALIRYLRQKERN